MFWLIFAVAVGARLLYAMLPPFAVTQYEEAVVGLMARHILQGDLIVLWWAQPYQGTFELYLIAGLFWLFGSSTVVLRILPFAISLAGLVSVYFLGRTLFNKKIAWLAILFLALPPVFLFSYSLIPYTGYMSLVALGALMMLWTYNLLFRRRFIRRISWHYFGIGFVGGFLIWQHLLASSFLLTSFILLIICERRFLRNSGFGLLAGGFLLGCAPLILWNLGHGFATYTAMASGNEAASWWGRLKYLFSYTLPEVLGPGMELWQKILFWVCCILPALWMLRLSLRALANLLRRDTGEWEGATFLLCYWAIPVLLFILFQYHEPRYLFPIYVSSPLLLAYFVSRWEKEIRWLAPLLMIAAVSVNLTGIFHFADRVKDCPRREIDSVIAFLKEQGTTHVFAHNRVALPLGFESREEIRASDFISYTDNRFHVRGFDFYMKPFFDEGRAVAKADKVGFVTHEELKMPAASQLEGWLQSIRAKYQTKSFGAYTVFYDVEPTHPELKWVDPSRYRVSSSIFPEKLVRLMDENLSTYWRAPSQENRRDFIEIFFEKPTPLAKISLLSGEKPLERAQNLVAEVTLDGKTWKQAADLSGGTIPIDWFGNFPRMIGEANRHLYFSGEKVRGARLSTVRPYPDRWALAEILVYEAGSQETTAKNWKDTQALQELARNLKEAKVNAVYGPKPLILHLQDHLLPDIASYNFFERRSETLSRSSARVDFSKPNAFIVGGEESKWLRVDLERLEVPFQMLRKFHDKEVWISSTKPKLPLMVWKEQRLFDYFSRREAKEFLKIGEEEWQKQHVGIAKSCFLASMKKDPNFEAYSRLKECYRQMGDGEGWGRLKAEWEKLFEPAIARDEIFGERIKLCGVTLPETKMVRGGESLSITCLWEALKPVQPHLGIFVHFLNSEGKVAFQADHNPGEEEDFSNAWPAGEKIADLFDVVVPQEIQPGTYEIYVGWWDAKGNKQRLLVTHPQDKRKKSRVKIGELVYEPDA